MGRGAPPDDKCNDRVAIDASKKLLVPITRSQATVHTMSLTLPLPVVWVGSTDQRGEGDARGHKVTSAAWPERHQGVCAHVRRPAGLCPLRYDSQTHQRDKTVALIEETVPWGQQGSREAHLMQRAPDEPVLANIDYDEWDLREHVRRGGGCWQPEEQAWLVAYGTASRLGLLTGSWEIYRYERLYI